MARDTDEPLEKRPRVDEPVAPDALCGAAAGSVCTAKSELRDFVPRDDLFWSWAAPLWTRSEAGEHAEMRAGRLSPFDAAHRRGLLCPGRREACEPQASATASLRPRLRSELVPVRIPTLSGGPQLLSTNCSLLEAQSEVAAPRRKLETTLRQTCGGGKAGRQVLGPGALLHERALCTLYGKRGGARVTSSL